MRVDAQCESGAKGGPAAQSLPPAAHYPARWEREEVMLDGTRALLRPIRPSDELLLKNMLESCSDETIYKRFFHYVGEMDHATLHKLVNIDYEDQMAIVGVVEETGRERVVAVGRYILNRATNTAEAAFLVEDAYQGRGIGTLLLRHLVRIAEAQGIAGFTADVLAYNRVMMDIFRQSGCEMNLSLADGVYHSDLHFVMAEKRAVQAA